ncbi:MAG: hypothetical protein ABFR62_01640 [Bacteroidota bacterium]
MKTDDNLLVKLHNHVIDFTTDLLELGYSLSETLRFGLYFIYNQKERQDLSTEQYIELESKYLQKIIAIS